MTEREKIIDVLNKNFTQEVECTPVYTMADGKGIALPQELCDIFNDIVTQAVIPYFTDALITAGLKFDAIPEWEYQRYCAYKIIEPQIKGCFDRERALKGQLAEAEHRAEVAERALDKAIELAYELRTEADTLSCSSCPMFHIFDSCKDRGLYKDCAKRWKEEWIKQAEKELAEEKKDE